MPEGREPYVPVKLVGGVAVYSEPENYPQEITHLPPWYAAVGVHPKHIQELTEDKFNELRTLLQSPGVSALGEIGLDYSVNSKFLREQENIFVKVLSLAVATKPIVLHLRGTFSDTLGIGVTARYHQLLRKNISPRQLLHVHCFTGDSTLVSDWLTEFPNTYFGYTALAHNFTEEQIIGLRSVPSDRILLETDSPYFAPRENSVNTPMYVGNTAEILARYLRIPVEQLLGLTLQNGMRLYRS
ncbi:hypothetical protein FSP39_024047 [Pinctada imbricata]|uniref:Uncharacterized protein n=1 Tax=Pinctada imbricata TaxID=66713 RepID=A0AA88YNW2_PINIB|nr:hypothetical protein FSP39_024047 [Pinctada imbricata]